MKFLHVISFASMAVALPAPGVETFEVVERPFVLNTILSAFDNLRAASDNNVKTLNKVFRGFQLGGSQGSNSQTSSTQGGSTPTVSDITTSVQQGIRNITATIEKATSQLNLTTASFSQNVANSYVTLGREDISQIQDAFTQAWTLLNNIKGSTSAIKTQVIPAAAANENTPTVDSTVSDDIAKLRETCKGLLVPLSTLAGTVQKATTKGSTGTFASFFSSSGSVQNGVIQGMLQIIRNLVDSI